jgi:hypothetical protein
MLDEATTGGSMPAPRCNWCSAILPSDHEEVCPSCGATLLGDGDTSVPGLTAIDAEAILRSARAAKSKPRSRLMGWISGDTDDGSNAAAAPGSLEPPPPEVRREMLRLSLEAQVANAQAEVESMAADDAIETGRSLAAPAETVAGGIDADAGAPDAVATAPTADATADAPDTSASNEHDEAPPA